MTDDTVTFFFSVKKGKEKKNSESIRNLPLRKILKGTSAVKEN